MKVITIKRRITGKTQKRPLKNRHPIRDLSRSFFGSESNWEFAVEALLFSVLLAISSWPIVAAAGAIHEFLARGPI